MFQYKGAFLLFLPHSKIWKIKVVSIHRKNHSSVPSVITDVQEKLDWPCTFHPSMRARCHSSVPSVKLALLPIKVWKPILVVYMRVRNSSVPIVMLALLKKQAWKHILQQYMRKGSLSSVLFVVLALLEVPCWHFILEQYMRGRSQSGVPFVILAFLELGL